MKYTPETSKRMRDERLLRYADWLSEHHGVPPTVREFAAWIGLESYSSAWMAIQALLDHDYLMHAVPSRPQGVTAANDLVLSEKGVLRVYALRDGALRRTTA